MVDELDIKIITAMENDPDASIEQMAKSIGVSKGTIRNRIIKLKEEQIVIGSSLKVKWRALGMDEVYLGLDIMPELYLRVLDSVKEYDFVKKLFSTSGDHSAIAYVVAESSKIRDNIAQIEGIQGVVKTYPAFVTNIIKW
ncbi:MAG: Lrp/AsnC family transcriptional regulator [Nitrososphaerota archaeon]|jgi:Lrp/AsnC family transcriptional regulator for asnA, asnC and gidA|nr:Lrp/AsnC family transcriptional regulator [Nitrososphaerota archaeon]MDG6927260.1 Lrp/AsnC family transcriptional regulator [Nitrososphaerota archaeon]MDG6930382.1 Lrp/AsnC family transcriptional regulator [Nitrososphaerota archaeon]MDG6932589.1 Lrp/AsnC family transcriptional regulator [Nitrososphaerota archaeon]MDG6935673.1 Lrp/AsnC family transcriptional regulator [Nitrososphaerota archaeon]